MLFRSEISALEAQKDKILQSSPVVVTQAELESIFDDVLKAQGIQRTQEMTKYNLSYPLGVRNSRIILLKYIDLKTKRLGHYVIFERKASLML